MIASASDIFTDETAAQYIGGIEARTVRLWRKSRGLPHVKLSAKVIRIRKADLDAWLQSRTVRTGGN
jgi:excisionase family DNA binding protein